MTGARQIFLGSRRKPRLPYDAEVEYLTSSGTTLQTAQYIDAGVIPDNTTRLVLRVSVISPQSEPSGTSGAGPQFGVQNRFYCFQNSIAASGNTYYAIGSSNSSFARYFTSYPSGFHTIDISAAGGIKIDNVSKISPVSETWQAEGSIYLFGRCANTTGGELHSWSRCSISDCKIFSGTTPVRDFIPVRFTNELGQSEGAMYDRVSRQLFRNQGTGAFLFGTDIAGGGYKWSSPLLFSRFSRLWKEAA